MSNKYWGFSSAWYSNDDDDWDDWDDDNTKTYYGGYYKKKRRLPVKVAALGINHSRRVRSGQ